MSSNMKTQFAWMSAATIGKRCAGERMGRKVLEPAPVILVTPTAGYLILT